MHAKKEEFSLELLSFFIIKRISEYTDVLGKTRYIPTTAGISIP